jgi:nucleoid-associated protein YgaU
VLLTIATALALSILPATQPGLGPDEGVFFQTQADDGGPIEYFIAQGTRHAILDADLQAELHANPLWPYRLAPRDEVLAFPEGSPIGNATVGRLTQPTLAEEPSAAEDAPAADDQVIADAPEADEPAADAEEQTYTVKRGDTLIGIAARFGTTEQDLMAANNISNRNRIYAGQVLTIG